MDHGCEAWFLVHTLNPQGTMTHMAPEVLLEGRVSKAADVSVGTAAEECI